MGYLHFNILICSIIVVIIVSIILNVMMKVVSIGKFIFTFVEFIANKNERSVGCITLNFGDPLKRSRVTLHETFDFSMVCEVELWFVLKLK
jgi:hypothetical protein